MCILFKRAKRNIKNIYKNSDYILSGQTKYLKLLMPYLYKQLLEIYLEEENNLSKINQNAP